MSTIRINEREIGPGRPAFVIAEVGLAHDGSLGLAHAFIDAVAETGVDAIKFQTHIAEAESSPHEEFRVTFSRQDKSRFDYWKRMEFSPEMWQGLAEHARQKQLMFLSSPFSVEAVDILERFGVPAWKVASGEISNFQMLRRMAETQKPILLSFGMSDWKEIGRSVVWLKKLKANYALFQCTTSYPCPPDQIGLNVMLELGRRYRVPVGLSDHSGTIFPGLAAVALGAQLLEVHVTLSRQMFGPDVGSSLTLEELRRLTEGVRFIERMLSSPVDKDRKARELDPLRQLFSRGVVAKTDLPPGTQLEEIHLTTLKPAHGIPAHQFYKIVGQTLNRKISKGEFIHYRDLEK